MLACGRVDDDCLISTIAVDLSHAEAVPLQPPSSLRSTQIYVQPVAFDFRHDIQPYVAHIVQNRDLVVKQGVAPCSAAPSSAPNTLLNAVE